MNATSDPTWLTGLRNNGWIAAQNLYERFPGLTGIIGEPGEISDPFIGLAASYLHEAYAKVAAAEERSRALAAELREARTRITALEADVTSLGGNEDHLPETYDRYETLRERVNHYTHVDLEAMDLEDILRAVDAATPGLSEDIEPPAGRRIVVGPDMQLITGEDVRIGDEVILCSVITGMTIFSLAIGGEGLDADEKLWISRDFAGLTIARPATPLPDMPGAVGTATVHGITGVRVMRSVNGEPAWVIAGFPDPSTPRFINSADLSDYVPLLDGLEAKP